MTGNVSPHPTREMSDESTEGAVVLAIVLPTGAIQSETTEQHAARLLKIAGESIQSLEAHQYTEIANLADQMAGRVRVWKRIARLLRERLDAADEEVERVQKAADDLAEVAKYLAELGAYRAE